MSKTFELGGELNTAKVRSTIDVRNQIIQKVGGDLEQVCQMDRLLIGGGCVSNLVGLAHLSFAEHRHMILDPDAIWLTIEHGLATHIKENAEELRSKFVTFQGKKTIDIRRDQFIRGGVNDWEGCFDEFSEKIGGFIGPKKDLIVGNFSTTGKLQRVSSEIVLMDAMSKYFDYSVTTLCHIPMITLTGSVEDWEAIRDKVNAFDEFGLSWWTDHLKPVLDQFVLAAKGEIDVSFWKSWYKEGGGSGGPFISGHVNAFFPYVDSRNERNKYMGTYTPQKVMGGNTLSDFNQSLSKVPFIWNYYDSILPMEFIGGLIGLTQDDQGAVRCAFGWAVRDEAVPLSNYPIEKLVKDMVIHHDGKAGLLKKAEAEHWDHSPDDKQLFEVKIEFDGVLRTFRQYEFGKLTVKTPVTDVQDKEFL
ncbi:DUF4419 domain-containing protein [Candidatus Pacearchaeota archaeon]|jgi:hypothetical protein|nr:DUF4419 domain-containing protein [Candidatus Pacearchaeota archaeon]